MIELIPGPGQDRETRLWAGTYYVPAPGQGAPDFRTPHMAAVSKETAQRRGGVVPFGEAAVCSDGIRRTIRHIGGCSPRTWAEPA